MYDPLLYEVKKVEIKTCLVPPYLKKYFWTAFESKSLLSIIPIFELLKFKYKVHNNVKYDTVVCPNYARYKKPKSSRLRTRRNKTSKKRSKSYNNSAKM